MDVEDAVAGGTIPRVELQAGRIHPATRSSLRGLHAKRGLRGEEWGSSSSSGSCVAAAGVGSVAVVGGVGARCRFVCKWVRGRGEGGGGEGGGGRQ